MTVREELLKIYSKHGTLTPEVVVKEARPKGHPLHHRVFDRGKDAAAEAWYLSRAQDLIRSVKIRYRSGDGVDEVRGFVSVRREDGFAYQPTEEVAQDDILSEIVRRDMEREWRQLKARYERYREFVDMVRRDLEAA